MKKKRCLIVILVAVGLFLPAAPDCVLARNFSKDQGLQVEPSRSKIAPAEEALTAVKSAPIEEALEELEVPNDPKVNPEYKEYLVGVDDILDISILKPDTFSTTVTVSPDGSITFPYIGSVFVKDQPLSEVQNMIQTRLADGYLKYPIVLVALKESRSRRFFVYGEVVRPGEYSLRENTTVLKAISIAGGFTKFGSSSRVKLLRPREGDAGYVPVKINIKAVMGGRYKEDVLIKPGDIVVVSEGMF